MSGHVGSAELWARVFISVSETEVVTNTEFRPGNVSALMRNINCPKKTSKCWKLQMIGVF